MSVREQFLKLQWTQLKHDEAYHKDVVIMPLAERIKHMALHNAKYTAYLFDAADTGAVGPGGGESFDIGGIDSSEGAEAPSRVVAMVHRPGIGWLFGQFGRIQTKLSE